MIVRVVADQADGAPALILPLKDRELLREAMLIDGQWLQADDAATFDVCCPSTGKVIARARGGADAWWRSSLQTNVGWSSRAH